MVACFIAFIIIYRKDGFDMNIDDKKRFVLRLKETRPIHYSILLKRHHKNIWDEIIEYNNRFKLDCTCNPQRIYNWIYDIEEIPKCPINGTPLSFYNLKFQYRKYSGRGLFTKEHIKERAKKRKPIAKEFHLRNILESTPEICPTEQEIMNCKQILCQLLDRCNNNFGAVITRLASKHKKELSQLKYMASNHGITLNQQCYDIVHDITEPSYCKYTGNQLKFISFGKGYQVRSTTPDAVAAYKRELLNKRISEQTIEYTDKKLKDVLSIILREEYSKMRQSPLGYMSNNYPSLIIPINERTKYLDNTRKFTERLYHIQNDIYDVIFTKNGTPAKFMTFENGYCMCDVSSYQETDLIEYIRSIYSGKIVIADRSVISPYELDIYLPEKNLAIELDGEYWHSQKFKPKNYHLDKTRMCEKIGIQLLHVFGKSEWTDKRPIISSILKSKMGILPYKIYARKCLVKELDVDITKSFLSDNHLQGYCKSSTNIGLYHNDELVSIMTFGSRKITKQKSIDIELLRFASKVDYSIVGAASKLFSYYINKYNPVTIKTYSDRRFSNNSKFYETLGFELDHISNPNYWYFKSGVASIELHHRSGFMKHKLEKRLNIYDPNKTEWQNMEDNGYNRIWDCGNYVFTWKRKEGPK